MEAQLDASLAGLSESEQVMKLRAQVLGLQLKLERDHITLAAAEDACNVARRKGAEETRQELEPKIEEVLRLYDEMRLERQMAAQSAVDAWTEARKLAALNEEETRTLTNRVQELEKELQQIFEVKLTRALTKDTEPPVEEEEEEPINMDHARQFVVEQRQASEPLRSKTPEPPRSKTPSGPRSKTPSIPRSSTPSAPRPRTPPDGRGRRGGRFSLNAICSAPVANPRGPPVTHAAGPSSR